MDRREQQQVAEAGEILLSANPMLGQHELVGRQSRRNTVSANSVDPNLKNDTTDEFIVGLDREVGRGFAVGASYIYRKYGNFSWSDRQGITSADWVADDLHADAGCPGDDGREPRRRNCAPVTFFSPAFQQPTIVTLTNVPDYNRGYQRVRADRPEADGEPLDDEHQLRLQRDQGELRLLPRWAAEHRRGHDLRGPDEPRSPARATSTTTSRPAAASATSTSTRSGCSR